MDVNGDEIEPKDIITTWKDKLTLKSESTADTYGDALILFLKWWKKIPPEEWNKKKMKKRGEIWPPKKAVEAAAETLTWTPENAAAKMVEFIEALKKHGRSDKYSATTWYALKSWFINNGTRKVKVDEKVPVGQETTFLDAIPEKKDLIAILDHSSMQVKAMVGVIAFGGLRPKDAAALEYFAIKDDFEAGITPMMIKYRVSKGGKKWLMVFLTSQGVRYIREWIEYREAQGEKFVANTPLFINLKPRKPKEDEPKPENGVKKRIGNRGLEQAIAKAMWKAGWKKKEKDPIYKYRVYGLRKYFRTNLPNFEDRDFREYLLAHKKGVNALFAIYDGLRDLHKPTIEKLRQEFIRAEPFLNTEIPKEAIVKEAVDKAKIGAYEIVAPQLPKVRAKCEAELKREITDEETLELYRKHLERWKKEGRVDKMITDVLRAEREHKAKKR